MQYEIRSVEPIGESQDLLLEIWHWHGNAAIGNRDPDFIEHVRLFNILNRVVSLQRNELGQPLRSDGTFGEAWLEVGGKWERWEPPTGHSNYLWNDVEVQIADLIEETVKNRSLDVKEKNRRGADVFSEREMPKVSDNPNHVIKRPSVAALKRKRGQVA